MNPTLYDILGVAPDADRDEIRRAWRDAADRFEPGSGGGSKQFRLFNEAAEVLLDPERRAAYDEQLAGAAAGGSPADRPSGKQAVPGEAPPESPEVGVVPGAPIPGASAAVTPGSRAGTTSGATAPTPDRPRRGVPWPVLAVLGVLTALAVAGAAYLTVEAQDARGYLEAVDRAPDAAESAAAAVLSYDHESLDADRDAAAKFLTPDYREDYVQTFDKLVRDSATETKATVEAEVLASSAMVAGGEQEADRVPVLLFVNQTTTSSANSGEPSVALNRVRMDMVQVDGVWLVDGITSY